MGIVKTFIVVCLVAASGCRFDPRASVGNNRDGNLADVIHVHKDARLDGPDGNQQWIDAHVDAGIDSSVDAQFVCQENAFSCNGNEASLCKNNTWLSVGRCFLGCDQSSRACLEPSNVDTGTLGFDENQLSGLDLPGGSTVLIHTDSGQIDDQTGGSTIRHADNGHIRDGVAFYRKQVQGSPDLGIFVFDHLTVPAGTVIVFTGRPAAVFLVAGDVSIVGTIDAGAHGQDPGPGGYKGGDASHASTEGGNCRGQPGVGTNACSDLCSSGSGGGGFGGPGGAGGALSSCNGQTLAAGIGGAICGTTDLVPLHGGGGGAGGVKVAGEDSSAPGAGGGGGGAIQISARGTISLQGGGGITVPGDGGGETASGGGSGGGAGGAILLEALAITADSDFFLTANGGGGGGGDCT
ncbi:MAG: hypothetical protein J7M25_15690 [Deltaproteobacteria bacterium]|nr:hypothetical protein [Deltaproteobacteria bacterium]